MKSIDLITLLQLVLGVFLGVVAFILIRQGKFKPKMWPRAVGFGGGVYMFVSSMITSILVRPVTEFGEYTVDNLFWSLAVGVVAYFSGQMFARRFEDKN